jgi:predicted TIM-barrel fold metal-dependent hydrolase
MSEKYAAASRPASPPSEPLPAFACDCHLHVFGDPATYPDRHPNPVHKSLEATVEDALAMHRSVGFGRGVLVQPANYMTDHRYLLEALARMPKDQYRATAIIDDSVSDAELARLHDAGVRGARFNFLRSFAMAPTPETFRRALDRLRHHGWYAKIFIGPEEWPDHIDMFRGITSVTVLIDHLGRTPASHPSHRLVLNLLRRENFWILLSNGARLSTQRTGFDDVVALGQALYAAAPDRSIFGTDWPHTHSQKEGGGPPEAALIELLYRYLPDAKARRAVLVDNPARLHGFG